MKTVHLFLLAVGRLLRVVWLVPLVAGVGGAMADVRAIQEVLRKQEPLLVDISGRGGKLLHAIAEHGNKKPAGWQEDVKRLQGLPAKELLQAAHELVNRRIPYQNDPFNEWLPPSVSFVHGGDCEDYAIAKLLLLREAGFPEAFLRVVTLVPVRLASPYHVILVAQLENRIYVLDSPGRAQSKDIVLLEEYREGNRPVAWAGWSGGFAFSSTTLNKQPAGRGYYGGLLFRRGSRFANLVGPADRLILVAADLRVITRRERPLNQGEIVKLRHLRAYYNGPSSETARLLTAYEAKKLDGFRKMRH